MSPRTVVRVVVLVVVTLVVQWTLGMDVVVGGAHPDLVVLLPIAAGIAAGPDEGAIVGFVAGMAADLLLPTPFGLSALVGCLVGFGVGATTGDLTRRVWWFPAGVALVASAGWVMLYAVLGAVLGEQQFLSVDLPAVVLVVSVCNAVLAAPAVAAARWAMASAPGERPSVSPAGRW